MDSVSSEAWDRRHALRVAAALGVVLALVLGVDQANAATPVVEFDSPLSAFPVAFTAEGGEVTAVLTDFDTMVHCAGSRGEGQLTGPRSASSNYVFTGCVTEGGADGGANCRSAGAAQNEIRSPTIGAELVLIDQGRREVGMLLEPGGGTYLSFECGGESVEAIGPFISPVGPTDQTTTSFTAALTRSGAVQIPDEYEGLLGERLQAIPIGEREGQLPGTTGVELSFTIHTATPVTVAVTTAAEVEARVRGEEAAKRRGEEVAANAAAAKRQDEEAASKKAQEEVAARQREEELAQAKARAHRLSKALRQCRKASTKQVRTRCESRAKKKFGHLTARQT